MKNFEKRDGGFVGFRPDDGGILTSQSVEANLMFAILEKLTEISETNKAILGEVDSIQPPS